MFSLAGEDWATDEQKDTLYTTYRLLWIVVLAAVAVTFVGSQIAPKYFEWVDRSCTAPFNCVFVWIIFIELQTDKKGLHDLHGIVKNDDIV
jgi:hypothetical protein